MIEAAAIDVNGVYDDGALVLILGVSSATLARERRLGRLRFTRKGKRVLYLGRWVIDWISAGDFSVAGQEARRG